ncbi:unnamed protein product [Ixodes pacificus]
MASCVSDGRSLGHVLDGCVMGCCDLWWTTVSLSHCGSVFASLGGTMVMHQHSDRFYFKLKMGHKNKTTCCLIEACLEM